MIYFVLLSLETVILFFLSRSVSKTFSKFMSINLLSFIFLPGIMIHELSHLLMATILFVPVGYMEFTPKRNGNGVKLGSIEIGKTDPIRRSVIGFAPVFVGLLIAVGAVYLLSVNFLFLQSQGPYILTVVILVLIYLLFAVSNTMFSSRADMKGTAEILATLLIFFGAAYFLGFRPPPAILDKILTPHPMGAGFTKEFIGIIQKSAIFLLVPISIDIVLLGTIKILRRQ